MVGYNFANKEVAILCNHQRSVPGSHEQSMAKLQEKKSDFQNEISALEAVLKSLKKKDYEDLKESWDSRENKKLDSWMEKAGIASVEEAKDKLVLARSVRCN